MTHGLLSGLSEHDRRSVLARMNRRAFRRNDTLFHEGDPGECLHLIEKGRVAIRVSTPAGDVAILAVLGEGDSFGEQALLGPCRTRIASVVALEPVQTRTLLPGPTSTGCGARTPRWSGCSSTPWPPRSAV